MEPKDDRRFHNLTQEQVETLDQVLTEVVPIHGRGNFPTLEIKPKDIIHVVRDRLVSKHIKVRDVRLNGSTASHVLVKENGTSYKDLDIIFGVELPKQEDFQIIKEVVLGCLLDFLPSGVNKDKITVLTMKEAYVQKMVKVFTEHDRWSLISLCNNSGKNVELKFVSSLRRQFEFSVDSFQIILDTILESYLKAERQEAAKNQQEASGLLNEQISSADTESSEQADINVLDRTVSHSDSEITEDQSNKASTEYTATEMVHKDQSEELTVSVMSAAPLEGSTELFDGRTDQNNEEQRQEVVKIHFKKELMSKTADQGHAQLPAAEAHSVSEEGLESILAEPEPAHTSITPEPEQCTESRPEPMVLTEQCIFQPSHSSTVSTQDTSNEFASPPPAKKTSWTSQMVVLKHSSPKPPRKMSRKVTCASKEKLRASDTNEHTPMQVESPGLTTNLRDQEPRVRTLDPSTTIVKEEKNTTLSEETLCVCPSPEKTYLQTPEPETGETTNGSVLSSLSKTLNLLTDMETETKAELEKPMIQINSQPLTESEETVGSNSSPKKASQPDCSQECLDMPETVLCIIESERTDHGFGLPECTIPYLLTQEPPVPHSPPAQPSHLLEPPVFIAQAEDFPKQLSSCLLEKEEYSVWPLESSTFAADGSPAVPVLAPPELFPQTPTQELSVEPSQLESPPEPPSQGPLIQPETPVENPNVAESERKREQTRPQSEVPCVTVVAESMYGDFEQAMDHLRYRLIATRNPEEIRGGGLLKYSNLLVRNFKPASETEIKTLERYMCSRFFIDFPDVNEQQRKIESYLRNHFIGEEKSKYDYLMTLRRVVNESTVCLMGHERRQTLNMITILALKVLGEQNIIPNTNNVTCYYQPAPYMTTDHNFGNYYIANGQSPLIYHPYPLHIHMQTGLV